MDKIEAAQRILEALQAGETAQRDIVLELEKARFYLAQVGVIHASQ